MLNKSETKTKTLVKQIKRCIRLNLEDNIQQILKDRKKNIFLTKRNIMCLINFMDTLGYYSINLIEYIFVKHHYEYMGIDRNWKKIPEEKFINMVLLWLSRNGLIDTLKFFLSKKMKELYPFINPHTWNPCILWACYEGHIDVVKFLLEDETQSLYPQINPCESDNYPIKSACINGHLEIVKFLLSDEITKKYPRIKEGIDNNTLLQICTFGRSSGLEVLKFLLSPSMKVKFPQLSLSSNNNDMITSACSTGRTEIMKFLLSSEIMELYPRIDPSASSNYCIVALSKSGNMEMVKLLLRDHRVIEKGLTDAIITARLQKHTEIADLLEAVDVDVDADIDVYASANSFAQNKKEMH